MGAAEREKADRARTSTEIGLRFRPRPPCTAERLRSSLGAVLPPILQESLKVSAVDELVSHYATTTSTEHDRKSKAGPLSHPHYPKAPPHWSVMFLDELADRVRSRQVTFSSQPVSEMKDRYRGQRMSEDIQPLTASPQQLLSSGAMNPPLSGQPSAGRVLLMKEPSLSTTHLDYRRYDSSEILSPFAGFALDHTPPGWGSTEGWGDKPDPPECPRPLGGAFSRIPAHKAPPAASCHPRLPPRPAPLPHPPAPPGPDERLPRELPPPSPARMVPRGCELRPAPQGGRGGALRSPGGPPHVQNGEPDLRASATHHTVSDGVGGRFWGGPPPLSPLS